MKACLVRPVAEFVGTLPDAVGAGDAGSGEQRVAKEVLTLRQVALRTRQPELAPAVASGMVLWSWRAVSGEDNVS